MDRRETAPEESAFQKDLQNDSDFNDWITIDGKSYRVPYRMVKEVVFENLKKEELKDLEHAARLQYRLMLMDPILKAKVEFNKLRATVTYNPVGADNRKEKISERELIDFIAKEGVHVDPNAIKERDVDYVKEIYSYQYDPLTIREHPPYGYTREQWAKMKPEWERKQAEDKVRKVEKFRAFQESYLEKHPELAKEYGYVPQPKKLSLKERIFGRKKEKEKGFWFHGA